jgi:cystathionine beta-lyase
MSAGRAGPAGPGGPGGMRAGGGRGGFPGCGSGWAGVIRQAELMDEAVPGLPVEPVEVLRQRRSAKWQTYPADVLPLTVAEMDFGLAAPVAAALREAVERSDAGYALAGPELGRALAGFAGRRWDWELDPASVTAVTDVGVGVVELLRVLTRPGDAVVISPPVYPPFFDWVPEAGARLLEVPLACDDGGWRLDLAGLEAAFATHPAVYLLCNPHNPVGRVHTAGELAELVRLARNYRVSIVSDEIHGPLALPGAAFVPLLTVPGAAEVAVSVLSASKAWNLAGLKCAVVVTAAPRMAAVTARFPPDTRWRVGHLGVLAAIAAFTAGEPWLDQLLATLGHRRDLLGDLLRQRLPKLAWHPPQATFLAWLDCTALGPDNYARERFLRHGRVALEPGLRFGAVGSGYARLNFATSADLLDQATARMAAAAG